MPSQAQKHRYWNQERETLSWPKRRERHNQAFVQTVSHALKLSAAYKEIYAQAGIDPDSIQSLDDLPRLPIIRMGDIVQRQKDHPPFGGFETISPSQARRIYVNPGRIFQPGEWEYQDTSWTEGLCGAGFVAGDRVLNTFNYHMWPYAMMLDESLKMIKASAVPTGVGNTLMQVKILSDLRLNGFMGTPSFLMTLAQRAEGMGLDVKTDLYLEKAMVGAEMLPESLRQRLQEKLKISIRQTYGTVLLGCLGYECQALTGLHVPDNVIVEVVDPNTGKPVPEGTAGEIVATNLSPTYPMIRLATGDLSLFSGQSCSCGRTGPILPKVLGRVDQATKVRGTFLHPWQTDEVIAKYPEVFKYQVLITRQNHHDEMTILVELSAGVDQPERLRVRLERDLEDNLTLKGTVKIVPPGTIPDFQRKIQDQRSWE